MDGGKVNNRDPGKVERLFENMIVKKKHLIRSILLTLPLLAFTGCWEHLFFKELDSGGMSGYHTENRDYFVFRDSDAYRFFHVWSSGSTDESPAVDFTHWAVVGSTYRYSSGGNSIEVNRVHYNANDIQVNILERISDGTGIQVITYPYTIARIFIPPAAKDLQINFIRSQIFGDDGDEFFLKSLIYGEERALADLALEDKARRVQDGAPVRNLSAYEIARLDEGICPQDEQHALSVDIPIGPINPVKVHFCAEHGVYYTEQTLGTGSDYQGPYQPGENEIPQNYQTLAQGSQSGYGVEGNKYFVLTDDATYRFLYAWVTRGAEAPDVDFDGGEAVSMAISARSTGGYSLSIMEVGHDSDSTTINVRESMPGTGEKVTYSNTKPYVIAKFDLVGEAYDVRFVRSELKDGQELTLMALYGPTLPAFRPLVQEDLYERLSFAEEIDNETAWNDIYPATVEVSDLENGLCPEDGSSLVVEAYSPFAVFPSDSDHPHRPDEALFCLEHGQFWTREGSTYYGPMIPGIFGSIGQ
jgi:hypothetical protein